VTLQAEAEASARKPSAKVQAEHEEQEIDPTVRQSQKKEIVSSFHVVGV
jgi:hypothetical protein